MIKRKGLPVTGELVLCTAHKISPYAAWCTLDEYEDLEGMVHISEVAGKWVHDIREFVKPNKQYVTKVVRIDEERNQINLSMKRVSKNEEKQKINSFRKEQRAVKILEQTAQALGKNMQEAYEEIGYKLQEKFGELFVAVEEIKEDRKVLEKMDLPKKWTDILVEIIEKTIKEKEIILKAELELRSYSGNGINDVKQALANIQKTGAVIRYISAPRYRIEMKTKDPKHDEKKLRDIFDTTLKNIKQLNGEGTYKFVK